MRNQTRNIGSLIYRLLLDEQGGELIEWVVVAGLIIVATISTVATFGSKVMAKWTSVNASM